MDAFFDLLFSQQPVVSTFAGLDRHNAQLPDWSRGGVATAREAVGRLLAACPDPQALPLESSRPLLREDVLVARGHLRIQQWELGSRHGPRGNPSLVVGEALFGVLSLFLTDSAPWAERLEAATARLSALPDFLTGAFDAVEPHPRAWAERAALECTGGLLFLEKGVHHLPRVPDAQRSEWDEAVREAASALGACRDRLHAAGSTPAADPPVACGPDALSLILQEAHAVEMDPRALLQQAESELATAREALQQDAGGDPDTVLASLMDRHPAPDEYLERFHALHGACRRAAEQAALLTWPEGAVHYVERPVWARAAAPFLYFLHYRSPPVWNRPAVHEVLVPPLDPASPESTLRRWNESVMKLNHVIHHGSVGHHVQNLRAYAGPSRVGRVAAVDGAARIAMLSGGTMAEGWACYATDLMGEVGFLSPLERVAERRARVRMCARAVADLRLHLGHSTLEQITDLYRGAAGMDRQAAHAEAVKNSMFPGGALMYMVGRDAIHALREELRERDGAAFGLRAFHDTVLSHGSLPVARIARHMRERPLTPLPPGAPWIPD